LGERKFAAAQLDMLYTAIVNLFIFCREKSGNPLGKKNNRKMKTIVTSRYLKGLIKNPGCIPRLFLKWHRNCFVYMVYSFLVYYIIRVLKEVSMFGRRSIQSLLVIGVIILGLVGMNGCKKGISKAEMILVELVQTNWGLNYAYSAGNVEILIRGDGVEKILLNSIEMIGDQLSASPLKACSATLEGDHVCAEFKKNQVITLLSNPAAGSTHTVRVTFYMEQSNDRLEVSAQVTISGGGGELANLTLEIDPDIWSLNYDKSAGTVEVFIHGDGLDNIDLNSVTMKGDSDAEALAAISVFRRGDHIHAKFPKNQVLGLLNEPDGGTTHTIAVNFLETEGTETLELNADITIEEDDDEEDPIDPTDLELEIDPDEWSLNYYKSAGTVEVFIEGEDIDKIDLNTIEMMGDNTNADPLVPVSVSINRNHIHARFAKSQVLDLLLNPEEGSTHTITVSFQEIESDDNERIELKDEITIEDDDDDEEDPEPSELELQLAPDVWNLNYDKSSGNVKAFLRGEGIENIDLDSIEMEGDNSGAEPLPAVSASRQGNHVKAEFPKNELLALLSSPAEGSTHTITVTFLEVNGSVRKKVSTEVRITGKDD